MPAMPKEPFRVICWLAYSCKTSDPTAPKAEMNAVRFSCDGGVYAVILSACVEMLTCKVTFWHCGALPADVLALAAEADEVADFEGAERLLASAKELDACRRLGAPKAMPTS